ncbi:MAG TPA: ATP-binding cassette domain-containing protein [Polyangiaceae bacterium]|jgi:ABC-type nitrate/sulfonate/bicarbonate transport system ATPase subunit|nr:ATP-binding cassette domain-containing protein [Polyangiaceae bacterium]
MTIPHEFKETLLTLDNVCLKLAGRAILSGVSARVRNVTRPGRLQGQVVGVLGPSGVGKTQLFRLLSGLTAPDEGKILVGSEQKTVTRGEVGVVAQAYPLFEHHTVLENLVLAARQHGLARPEAHEQASRMLQRFLLQDCARAYPATLSGGQRQRAAIAQQLIRPKPLLLMDEPFSGLDLAMVKNVCDLLAEVACQDELLTIVLVTHDIAAALSVADTLWLLGRPRSENGAREGARIVQIIDLIERGLAWHPDVMQAPAFAGTKREIEQRFASL